MKIITILLSILLLAFAPPLFANRADMQYEKQIFNPADTTAPVAGLAAAMYLLPLGVGVVAVGAIAGIVIATSSGNTTHSHG